jgi:MoaA/NifB/PqqE/SkfB family radical SAM enzyme
MKFKENKKQKIFISKEYNYFFDKTNGFFARWGKTEDEDPIMSLIGPEIIDIEISTICSGVGEPCKFCYKSNTQNGQNMSLETFKKIINNLPFKERNGKREYYSTQIAFGIGDINSNPDFWNIMEYSRENGIIPNVTINGWNISDEEYDKLANICGAVAVSDYGADICYEAVKKLTDRGMKQVNIHKLVSEETIDSCMNIIDDVKNDKRLKKLNAVVFLMLKKKGRGKSLSYPSKENYKKLMDKCLKEEIRFGMDSCSCNNFLDIIKDHKDYDKLYKVAEPCESSIFSLYINTEGKVFSCSFCEGEKGWEEGLDMTKDGLNFFKDIWYSEKLNKWRKRLLNNNRSCPMYDI